MRKEKYFIKRLVSEFSSMMLDEEWAHDEVKDILHKSNTAEELKANILDSAMDSLSKEDAEALCDELFADVDIASIEAYLMDKQWISEFFVFEDGASKLFL